jgi:unsaturated chondroitin disaccharide hydrolase
MNFSNIQSKLAGLTVIGVFLLIAGFSYQKDYLSGPALALAEKHLFNALAKNTDSSLFPRTTNWRTGELEKVKSGDWTSGFFPGSLWYMYEVTNNPDLKKNAIRWLTALEKEQFNTQTHDLGFMMFCSYGNAYRLTKNPKYKNILLQSARSLSARFKPKTGVIRSWDHKAKGSDWQYPVIIDNMMNLELLFWASRASKDSSFYKIAITHANTTMANHFRADGSSFHVVDYDTLKGTVRWKGTHQGYANASSWSRGQAWGLYGFVVMYRETRQEKYLKQAEAIAAFYLNHRNLPSDLVPYWDFNAPDIPNDTRDASAAAVTASALLELSTFIEGRQSTIYRNYAEKMLISLSSPSYLAKEGTNNNFVIMHCTGTKPANVEVDVPLNYADYYFIEGLMRYNRLMEGKPVIAPAVY